VFPNIWTEAISDVILILEKNYLHLEELPHLQKEALRTSIGLLLLSGKNFGT
jgi:hypothetical protein